MGLFLVLLLIVGVFGLLFWSIKNALISVKSALIMLGISLVSFLVFPGLAGKLGFSMLAAILLMFVFFGMILVMIIEETSFINIKLNSERGFWDLGRLVKKYDWAHKFNFLQNIINRNKAEDFIIWGEKKSESSDTLKLNEVKQNTENEEMLKKFTNSDNLSYVDFEEKSEKYGDVFSKFIRGEIPMEQVRENIMKTSEPKTEIENTVELKVEVKEINEQTVEKKDAIEQKVEIKDTTEQEVKVSDNNEEISDSSEKVPSEEQEILDGQEQQEQSISEDINDEAGISVEKYVELAFEAKTQGKFMEAIEYYINALEKKPEEQLALWVVIDICSIYREMGQENLAKEMIESYIETAGENLSLQVKEEILNNFNI